MASIQSVIQHHAQETIGHQRHVSYAVVVQVDHKRNRAKVRLMPQGEMTGWLRIGNVMAGNGWMMHFPLEKDDEVLVEMPNGQKASGIITWRLHSDVDKWSNRDDFNDQDRKCSYKDVFLVHKTGSFLRFFGENSTNSRDGRGANGAGDITLRAKGRGTLRLEADTRLELVAPNVRIRTGNGADSSHYFVMSDFVDHFISFVSHFNTHNHFGIPPMVPWIPPIKTQMVDMKTQGSVGF